MVAFYRTTLRLAAGLLLVGLGTTTATAQPAGLTTEGGLGLAVTTVAADLPAGWGLHVYAEPRLGGLVGVRVEGGLTLFDPLCFDLDDAPCAPQAEAAPARMLSGSVAAAVFSPPVAAGREGWQVAAGVYAGHEAVEAWRGARHCVNCRTESISLRGGFFAEPSAVLWAGPLGVGLGMRFYEPHAALQRRLTLRLLTR